MSTTISDLPPDALLRVFRHLPSHTQLTVLPRVCPAWRAACQGSGGTFHHLGLQLRRLAFQELYQRLRAAGVGPPLLLGLRLPEQDTITPPGPPPAPLPPAGGETRSLTLLLATRPRGGGFSPAALLACLPRLERLALRGADPQWGALCISTRGLAAIARGCPRLQSLVFTMQSSERAPSLAPLAGLPHLTRLWACYCPGGGNWEDLLHALWGSLSQLRRLAELRLQGPDLDPEWEEGPVGGWEVALSPSLRALCLGGDTEGMCAGLAHGPVPTALTCLALETAGLDEAGPLLAQLPQLLVCRLACIEARVRDMAHHAHWACHACLVQLHVQAGFVDAEHGGGWGWYELATSPELCCCEPPAWLALPSLEVLELGGCHAVARMIQWRSLARLQYAGLEDLSLQAAQVSLCASPRLRDLVLVGVRGITRDVLRRGLTGLQLRRIPKQGNLLYAVRVASSPGFCLRSLLVACEEDRILAVCRALRGPPAAARLAALTLCICSRARARLNRAQLRQSLQAEAGLLRGALPSLGAQGLMLHGCCLSTQRCRAPYQQDIQRPWPSNWVSVSSLGACAQRDSPLLECDQEFREREEA